MAQNRFSPNPKTATRLNTALVGQSYANNVTIKVNGIWEEDKKTLVRKPFYRIQHWPKSYPIILAACTLLLASAQAQQTIFNAPSAEVMPKGESFLQYESQFRTWEPGQFINSTEYFTHGIGHNAELAATLFNVNAPASGNITLAVGFKKVFPLLEQKFPRREFKFTVGQMLPISLQGQGVGNWSYTHLSARVPKLNTRLTAGVSTGTRQIFGRTTVHFIGSYEQPVTKRLTLQGDWYSGTHDLGFFITGFGYKLPKNMILYGGYQIPNNARCGRQGFVFEVSKHF